MKKIPLLQFARTKLDEYSEKEIYAFILCGELVVAGQCIRDPKFICNGSESLEVRTSKYVSRGGEKLQAALDSWGVDVQGKIFLDAGASTGGFTDCLLQAGAEAVHAVDVGFNQLHFKLRNDTRVYVHEKTNIMSLESLSPAAQASVADLSFRSLFGALEKILSLSSEHWGIFLLKPQFEDSVFTQASNFKGVLSDSNAEKVFLDVCGELNRSGLKILNSMASPIKGRKGNQEYLLQIAL
jgi:23S rRNA (cytidine1920-2'-O)/16S rRNA (cytidine1409-2'-O)-methyltransferase